MVKPCLLLLCIEASHVVKLDLCCCCVQRQGHVAKPDLLLCMYLEARSCGKA